MLNNLSTRASKLIPGTWELAFSRDAVVSWQTVASDCCYLPIETARVHSVDINSHGDAVYHLRLPGGVIDPVSLRQIRQEDITQKIAWHTARIVGVPAGSLKCGGLGNTRY